MTERLTGVEIQAELLAETRRLREAAEGIRNFLLIMFAVGFIAAIVWLGITLSS